MGISPHPCGGVPAIDYSHCKKKISISYIKMKPLMVQLVLVAPCPLHVAPCEERTSILFVVAL